MLKFNLDKISPDGSKHVAYVQMVDDDRPDTILATACIPYTGDEEAFLAAVEKKFAGEIKNHESRKDVGSVAGKVASALEKIDAGQILNRERNK
jgi:hypothetical protein